MEANFTDKEWHGEFFLPDQHETRFIGTVTFSPEEGVVLSYQTALEVDYKTEILHGILNTGEPCTLIGKFPVTQPGIKFKGGVTTYNGKIGFQFMLVGAFLEKNELFSEISFSLTGMQEFFFPEGYKNFVKFSTKPLLEITTDYGEIKVGNNAIFDFLGSDITSQIHNYNADALNELKNAYNEINTKYEDSHFMFKKEISYMVVLKTNVKSQITTLLDHIRDISNLFAILIYRPVYPETIKLHHIDSNKQPYTTTIYPAINMEKRTLKLCKNELSHFDMPIKQSNIDLSAVIKNWLIQKDQHMTIVHSLQHETGFRNEHSLHGEIVMYATQLESISEEASVDNNRKYEYPINEYGTPQMRNSLIQILQRAQELNFGSNFGGGISKLRNEIAHVSESKELLSVLSIEHRIYISIILQATILGYVLNKIGVDNNVIANYQNEFTPNLTGH